MRTYIVEIKATITERIEVDALNEDAACDLATEVFYKGAGKTCDAGSDEVVDWEDVSDFRRKVA